MQHSLESLIAYKEVHFDWFSRKNPALEQSFTLEGFYASVSNVFNFHYELTIIKAVAV